MVTDFVSHSILVRPHQTKAFSETFDSVPIVQSRPSSHCSREQAMAFSKFSSVTSYFSMKPNPSSCMGPPLIGRYFPNRDRISFAFGHGSEALLYGQWPKSFNLGVKLSPSPSARGLFCQLPLTSQPYKGQKYSGAIEITKTTHLPHLKILARFVM